MAAASAFTAPAASNIEEVEVTATDNNPHFRVVSLGKPIAWMRPEFISGINKHTGNVYRNVTVNKKMKMQTNSFRVIATQQLKLQHNNTLPCIESKRVSVTIWFCKRPTLNFFRKNDRVELKPTYQRFAAVGKPPLSRVEKPDIDNMVKFVLDALKGIGWSDDDQVAVISAYKCVDLHPPFEGRTVIEFRTLVADSDLKPIPNWGMCQHQP